MNYTVFDSILLSVAVDAARGGRTRGIAKKPVFMIQSQGRNSEYSEDISIEKKKKKKKSEEWKVWENHWFVHSDATQNGIYSFESRQKLVFLWLNIIYESHK